MRAIILCAATFTLGAIMSDAIAEEPKKESPRLDDKKSYTDKVTVREKTQEGFVKPLDTVAFWGEVNGKKFLYVWTAGTTIKVTKGSEITEAKTGDVWVVDKPGGTGGNPFYICEVTKKPADKP